MFFHSTKSRIGTLGALAFLLLSASTQAQNIVGSAQPAAVTILDSTKEQDGLIGPVRRVRTEAAKLELQGDKLIEGQRQLLEITTYGPRGERVENVSYPSASSPIGKEEYKYDKGNMVEMTLRDDSGTILSREAYSYEFDRFGNWTKMVTNLLVYEGGALKQEPTEVTYRKLTYYFDDQIAKIVKPPAPEKMTAVPAPSGLNAVSTTGVEALTTTPSHDSPVAPAVPAQQDLAPTTRLYKPLDTQYESTGAAGSLPLNDPYVAAAPLEAPKVETPRVEPPKAVAVVDTSAALAEKETRRGFKAPKETAPDTAVAEPASLKASPAKTAPPNMAANEQGFESFKAGRNQFEAGDLKGALAAFIRASDLQPDSAETRLSLGLVYLKLEKNKDAAKTFKDAVRLDPNAAEAQYGLGLASFRIGRHKDAADAFKRATVLRPDMAKAHYGLALAYQELGKEEGLVEEFRILQTLDPTLARQLAQSFPESNLPCSFKCK
jgi:Tfp pilus assembly protein PilF